MKSVKYYLKEGKTYYNDNNKLKYVCVSNPELTFDFAKLSPDETEGFVEVKNASWSKPQNSVEEKLYRVLTDIATITFLNDETFDAMFKRISEYLMEIEDWERMCVLRDVESYYRQSRGRRKSEIDDFIKTHDK